MGSAKAGRIISGCVICTGIIVIIVGASLLGAAPGQEIPMWWGVTICKTASGDWVGYPSTTTCPAATCPTLCNSQSSQAQTIQVDSNLVDSNLNYSVAMMRTENDVTISYTVTDSTGAVLTSSSDSSLGQTSSITSTSLEAWGSPSRQLLKSSGRSGSRGGISGSSRSRSRSGSSFRWGSSSSSSTSRRTTSYGKSGRRAVTSATVVVVYRRGPRNPKYNNNYANTADHNNCADKRKGCEYTLPADMVRDEFTKAPTIRPKTYKPPYFINILNMTVKPTYTGPQRRLLASTDPEVYFSLFSADTIPTDATGGIMIGVGVALLVGGCALMVYIAKKQRE